ncbi:glycosyltransferase family 2 protein [Gigaspora margarita]|uniref:Chitin synthase n=1 Tax=Gigaspora margarita TaxID=4874 RepID=A0A8H3XAM9_GIGMA|nr:glycosyltransferase family 2 protein [Gigaspora margarita]
MENKQNEFMSGGGSSSNDNIESKTEKIKLINERFIRDCQIPSNLLENCKLRDDREFTHMRYTACTCDPDDFLDDGFTLRQAEYKRQTELFIVVTMYDEDVTELSRTFHGIVENIASLCSRKHRIWDIFYHIFKFHKNEDSWQKVVVCIVSDGRKKFHESCLDYLTALGVYQDGVSIESIDEVKVKAHIFEYTTQISVDQKMKAITTDVPIQMLFFLQPKICILIDVGTRPGNNNSLYNLWETFISHPNVAGACGEIFAMTTWYKLLNPIVGAQYFEYKMSNILDKPLESVFGYITVLPGAFSAYRYIALQNNIVNGVPEGPLASYFKCEKNEEKSTNNIFTANMYLAEDRILCFELVTKRNGDWLLHYVKSSIAETDIPKSIDQLISQRRRWLNGSFFASLYAVSHFYYILRSKHSSGRKFFLLIEMLYRLYNLFFSWSALGNLYLTLYILGNSFYNPQAKFPISSYETINKIGEYIFNGVKWVYFALIFVQFIFAMGNKPKSLKHDTNIISLLENITFRSTILALFSTYGLYFLASLLMLDPWHMFTCIIQYILLVPFYVNILNIYAFCNVHDVSWGTREEDIDNELNKIVVHENSAQVASIDITDGYEKAWNSLNLAKENKPRNMSIIAEKEYRKRFKRFRIYIVFLWILTNIILVIMITTADPILEPYSRQSSRINAYIAFILWSVAGLAAFRFFGSLVYFILELSKTLKSTLRI